jgi:phosphonate transport system ATP-binding protein
MSRNDTLASQAPPIEVNRAFWMVQDTVIVSDVSLSIERGQRIVILGPNGAGKSSLLKLMGLIMQPSMGQVAILGQNPWAMGTEGMRALRTRIGWIPQGLQVVGRLSVMNNAVLGSLARVSPLKTLIGWFPDEEIERARAALQAVGMEDKADRRTDTLSGGERQKVAIARALVQGGEVLLADEPTAALDPVASRDMMQLIRDLSRDRNLTTVTVLHDIDLALEFADRILGMSDGKLVLDAPASAVQREQLDRLYHHLPPDGPGSSGGERAVSAARRTGKAVLRLLTGRVVAADGSKPPTGPKP